MKKEICKFFKLGNQYLKIMFSYNKEKNIWLQTIVIAKSKRKCNDGIRKTKNSPKILLGKQTGTKLGIKPFVIALRELLEFEKGLHDTQIIVTGVNDRLNNIYTYLKKYGYEKHKCIENNKEGTLMYKKIE